MHEIANHRTQSGSFGEFDIVVRQHRPDPNGGVFGRVGTGLNVSVADGRGKFGKLAKRRFDGVCGDIHTFHLCKFAVRRKRYTGLPQCPDARGAVVTATPFDLESGQALLAIVPMKWSRQMFDVQTRYRLRGDGTQARRFARRRCAGAFTVDLSGVRIFSYCMDRCFTRSRSEVNPLRR